jgi:hypothetical protein
MQNNESATESITLDIVPKEPFTLVQGEQTKTFSRVDAYGSVSQSYKLKVDESAVSATYDLEFRYYRPSVPGAAITKKLPISVQGSPKIVIDSVETEPESMEPGDTVEITFNLRNEGTGEAKGMELSIAAEADSETGEPLIVPVLSGGITYVGDFGPGEEKAATLKLEIDNEAESKSYLSTLTVDYKDEGGDSQSTTFSIGIPVKGVPLIEVLSAKVDNGAYKVDIENVGTGTAKALQIAFVQGGEVKDSSVASELKPTKAKTLRFTGFSYAGAAINISYLDEEIPVTVTKSVYAEESTGGTDPTVAIVLLLVVVLETVYLWRLRKRVKK